MRPGGSIEYEFECTAYINNFYIQMVTLDFYVHYISFYHTYYISINEKNISFLRIKYRVIIKNGT